MLTAIPLTLQCVLRVSKGYRNGCVANILFIAGWKNKNINQHISCYMERTIEDLTLVKLSKRLLSARQMGDLFGGVRDCTCSCTGTSSSSDNRTANYNLGDNGGYSTSGCNQYGELQVGSGSVTGYCEECKEGTTGTYYT